MIGHLSFITDPYARADGTRKHDINPLRGNSGTRDFVAIDGEGVTLPSGEHRYVLLGVGQDQLENPAGLQWREIFDFIYERQQPKTAFVGFYLGYDFTQWLKTMPEDRVRRLLTIDGKEQRRSRSPHLKGKFLPVDVDDWQVDVLGSKRLQFRYKPCDCVTVKCEHPKGPWCYICDAGPFFQTSFLNVINPKNWLTPIVTPDEYKTILAGKEHRSDAALDDDMRRYNRLENEILARAMHDLNSGFQNLDINLSPSQWYGPGQAAQSWMSGRSPKRTDLENTVPQWFSDAARASYFGGWFEQQVHGIIPGTCYESDINSAYPAIIANLPCLMHGKYTQGVGKPPKLGERDICLVRALVWESAPGSGYSKKHAIGAMLHRDAAGRISRPLVTAGWYWLHELQAAQRARCVRRMPTDSWQEWVRYEPCDCPPPLRQVRYLYQMRLDVGKKASLSKAAKLAANSIYGKEAQSVGTPRFANPVYASLITAGCRTMILDAIATHPGGKHNVVMVATDAIFTLDPHPGLIYGTGLGEWECKARESLTLFKPGVYWDDEARDRIHNREPVAFKARGISARDFAHCIAEIDDTFRSWDGNPPPVGDGFDPKEREAMGETAWPKVTFTSTFAMVTALQALLRNDWASAGAVSSSKSLVQNANPWDKRCNIWYDTSMPGRPIYRSEPHYAGTNARYRTVENYSEWENFTENYSSVPYEKRFGSDDPFSDESTQLHGINPDEPQLFRNAFRVLTGQD